MRAWMVVMVLVAGCDGLPQLPMRAVPAMRHGAGLRQQQPLRTDPLRCHEQPLLYLGAHVHQLRLHAHHRTGLQLVQPAVLGR